MQTNSSGEERNLKFHEGQIVKWNAEQLFKLGCGVGIIRGLASAESRIWIVQLLGCDEKYPYSCIVLPEPFLSPESPLSAGGI